VGEQPPWSTPTSLPVWTTENHYSGWRRSESLLVRHGRTTVDWSRHVCRNRIRLQALALPHPHQCGSRRSPIRGAPGFRIGRGAALLWRPRRLLNPPGGAKDPRSFRPSVGARRGKEQYCRRRLGACKDPGLGDVRKRSQADRLGAIAAGGDLEVGHAFSKRDRPERCNRTSGLPRHQS
jgi:hypothetical protein